MKLQRLLSLTRQAIDDYQMISDGDRIAIGLSGGKDSLALLYSLHFLQQFYPRSFQLYAITVDLGFDEFDLSPITELCDQFKIPHRVVTTSIGQTIFEIRKDTNPCALCAKLRKGAFNAKANELNCNKIAYAHHRDDLIETMLLSLLYEGRFHSFSPYTYLDRANLALIRPLLYVEESDIIGFKNRYSLPICKNPCPADGHTKRQYIKSLVKQLEKENRGVKDRLFRAIQFYLDGSMAADN